MSAVGMAFFKIVFPTTSSRKKKPRLHGGAPRALRIDLPFKKSQ